MERTARLVIVAPPAAWDPVGPKFHNLTIRVFDRNGHWPHYEESAIFDEELLFWKEDRQ